MITVWYSAVDGFKVCKRFKSLQRAQGWAHGFVGQHPTIGSCYAVSDDGVGKIEARGATLAELFPPAEPVFPAGNGTWWHCELCHTTGGGRQPKLCKRPDCPARQEQPCAH